MEVEPVRPAPRSRARSQSEPPPSSTSWSDSTGGDSYRFEKRYASWYYQNKRGRNLQQLARLLPPLAPTSEHRVAVSRAKAESKLPGRGFYGASFGNDSTLDEQPPSPPPPSPQSSQGGCGFGDVSYMPAPAEPIQSQYGGQVQALPSPLQPDGVQDISRTGSGGSGQGETTMRARGLNVDAAPFVGGRTMSSSPTDSVGATCLPQHHSHNASQDAARHMRDAGSGPPLQEEPSSPLAQTGKKKKKKRGGRGNKCNGSERILWRNMSPDGREQLKRCSTDEEEEMFWWMRREAEAKKKEMKR